MKNSVALLIAMFAVVMFTSCTKTEFIEVQKSALVRDDNPPKGMFYSMSDYGNFNKVLIEKEDFDKAIYYGNMQTGSNSYWDQNTGQLVNNIYYQEYYKIPAKKYWGTYQDQIWVSKSWDYFLVPGPTMATFKDIILRKGSVISYLSGQSMTSQWRSIDGAE